MEKFLIEPTRVTPMIHFDPEQGFLEIKGRSSPANAHLFYRRVLNGLDQIIQQDKPTFTTSFFFEYFNTSTSKCLFDIFKRLRTMNESGKQLTINWYFEVDDRDMMETGEDYADLMELEFHFLEIEPY